MELTKFARKMLHDSAPATAAIVRTAVVTRVDAAALFARVEDRWPRAADGDGDASEFEALVHEVSALFSDVSAADVRRFLDAHGPGADGKVSFEGFYHFFSSLQPMREVSAELNLQDLAAAHMRARDSLVDELARLQLEWEEAAGQAGEDSEFPEFARSNQAAKNRIWDIIRQCQIQEQIQDKGVSKLELTHSAQQMFAAIDTNNNGYLSREEVHRALSGFGVTFVEDALRRMRQLGAEEIKIKPEPAFGTAHGDTRTGRREEEEEKGLIPEAPRPDGEIDLAQFESGLVPMLQRFLLQKEVRKLKLRRRRHREVAAAARERETSAAQAAAEAHALLQGARARAEDRAEDSAKRKKEVALALHAQALGSWMPPPRVGAGERELETERARAREMEWEQQSLRKLGPFQRISQAEREGQQGVESGALGRERDAQAILV